MFMNSQSHNNKKDTVSKNSDDILQFISSDQFKEMDQKFSIPLKESNEDLKD